MTTAPPTFITGVDFVAVPAEDFEASVHFYGTVLGLPPVKRWGDMPGAEFQAGNLTIAIMEPDRFGQEFRPHGLPVEFQVDDVDAARAHLEEQGVRFVSETHRQRRLPPGDLPRPGRQLPGHPPPLRAEGLMSVAGKTAIVTGAGTGIGRATAQLLAAARGARRRRRPAAREAARDGRRHHERPAARRSPSTPTSRTRPPSSRWRRAAQDAFGGTDVLVNNAAVYPIGPWHEMDAAQWDAVFATNIRGYFLMARAVRPQMIARGGGAVVNVASVTFFTGNALLLAYVASKGAVIGFTRALAREAGPEGIRANAVAPGAFPTAATEIHADQEGLWRDVLEAQSIKRRGEVEDVARAIAFFASDDSSFVSGQTLLVDGGWMFG